MHSAILDLASSIIIQTDFAFNKKSFHLLFVFSLAWRNQSILTNRNFFFCSLKRFTSDSHRPILLVSRFSDRSLIFCLSAKIFWAFCVEKASVQFRLRYTLYYTAKLSFGKTLKENSLWNFKLEISNPKDWPCTNIGWLNNHIFTYFCL